MTLLFIAYLGGVLTILSPCILPVLPFVLARAQQPFFSVTFPMLAGMAITFAAIATLAAFGGGWAVHANIYGRAIALVGLAVFGVTLVSPRFASWLTLPLVSFGNRLLTSARGPGPSSSLGSSVLLGVATGFLWAPCAGPILGLVLTGAALQGATAGTTFLLLAYSAGAATSLALAVLVGGRMFAMMKQSLGAGEWVRRGLGVIVIAGTVAIAFGADTGFLAGLSSSPTTRIEQALLNAFSEDGRTPPANSAASSTDSAIAGERTRNNLPVEGGFPSLDGAVEWLNSAPLTNERLRGKVVLVDFWTYSCINCIHTVPYVQAWAEKYKDQGLVVIGVHAPEFAFEKKIGNVRKAVSRFGITYPVAIDNDYKIWRAFHNNYWPAHYFIDAEGRIRYHHFGEGAYDKSERVIQNLLAEAKALKAEAAPKDEAAAPRG